MNDTAENNFTI